MAESAAGSLAAAEGDQTGARLRFDAAWQLYERPDSRTGKLRTTGWIANAEGMRARTYRRTRPHTDERKE